MSGERKAGGAKRDVVATEAMAHLDHLYRVAFYLAKDASDAEDLVQETFARALAANEQFDPATNMKAWLRRSCAISFSIITATSNDGSQQKSYRSRNQIIGYG